MLSRIDEIRARLDAASPGPWDTEGPCMSGDGTYGVWSEAAPGEPTIAHRMAEADADFIAHSRDDVAWLLNELEEVRYRLACAAMDAASEVAVSRDDYDWHLAQRGVTPEDAEAARERRFGRAQDA